MREDSEGATRAGARSRVMVVGVVVALVAVAAGGALLAGRDDGGGTVDAGGPSGAVPGDTLSPPGTALPGGLEVAEGTRQVGPVVVEELDDTGEPASWYALVVVEGDPATAWERYVGQVAALYPGEGIEVSPTLGCRAEAESDGGEACHLAADEVEGQGLRENRLTMVGVPGDVTGRYLIRVDGSVEADPSFGDSYERGGYRGGDGDDGPGPGNVPEPPEARRRPGVGEPLAPRTTAYEGDDEDYVLLEGSELLTQYGAGSVTGGFEVLLRVSAGAQLDQVAAAYAEQATQWEEPLPEPEVLTYDGTTYTTVHPPGGAGGYSGEVTAIDGPGDADYIAYSLIND